MKAMALAVRFLTVLPWPGAPPTPEANDAARALARFPFVGLLVGGLLVLLDWALAAAFSVPVRSVLLVLALAWLTRGSGPGGLSGFADALDSRSAGKGALPGPMGVLAVVGAILLKFVCLSELRGDARFLALMLSPTLARAATASLLASLPSAKGEGSPGQAFARAAGSREGRFALGWAFALSFVLGWFGGLMAAIAALCLTWGLKRLFGKSTGEGDAPGAAGEIVETASLVLFASW